MLGIGGDIILYQARTSKDVLTDFGQLPLVEPAQLLDNTSINVSARVTPTGRYYGAITSARIAEELTSTLGREIDRRIVEVIEPIREPGEHEISLRLSADISATIHVMAETEE